MRLFNDTSSPMGNEEPLSVSLRVCVNIFEREAPRYRSARIGRWWESASVQSTEHQPDLAVNFHNLPADIAPQVVTRHLFRSADPNCLVVFRVLPVRKTEIVAQKALQEARTLTEQRTVQLALVETTLVIRACCSFGDTAHCRTNAPR